MEALGKGVEGAVAVADGRIVGILVVVKGLHLSGGRTDFLDEIQKSAGSDGVCTCPILAVDPKYRGLKISKNSMNISFPC